MEIDSDLYLKRTVVHLKCTSQFLMRTLNVMVTKILCPKNVDVDQFNENILQTLPGKGFTYQSADAVQIGDDQGLCVTTEFLNKITLSGLPPHLLTVKVGCVMMLLRNLNPKNGLCNGTRIIIVSMTKRLIRGIYFQKVIKVKDVSCPELHYIRQTIHVRLNSDEDNSLFDKRT